VLSDRNVKNQVAMPFGQAHFTLTTFPLAMLFASR
jgi:hypothetical protein